MMSMVVRMKRMISRMMRMSQNDEKLSREVLISMNVPELNMRNYI